MNKVCIVCDISSPDATAWNPESEDKNGDVEALCVRCAAEDLKGNLVSEWLATLKAEGYRVSRAAFARSARLVNKNPDPPSAFADMLED